MSLITECVTDRAIVWQSTMAQIHLDGQFWFVITAVLILLTTILAVARDSLYDDAKFLCTIGMIFGLLVSVTTAAITVDYLHNPSYAAIKRIASERLCR